jgi:glutathione synthase/RimK-type ligase-like ATP-grasp enzyme
MGYDRLYFLKKAYAIYPGVVTPVSGGFLAEHYRRRRATRGPLRAALDLVVGLAFLAWIPWRAAKVRKKFGLDEAWRRRAVAIARARFADPQDLALFRIEEAAALDGYVRRFEDAALNKRINPRGWARDCALADKARFYARCREASLPHPETVATVTGGRLAHGADPAGRELVAKPADGEGGDGLVMLGPFADAADLAARLPTSVRMARGMMVIQPRIATHPTLRDLALAALPTVRVVTILDEAGAPEVASATFRFASDPAAQVDNMKAGGLISAVDLEAGTLGLACLGYGGGDHAVHPATGARIVGRTLPDWPAVKALAIRAHADAFGDYALIGWDVAMTLQGPLLIEGNGKPGVLMPQRAARRGLGEGRYGELLAHHLATKA